MEFLFCRLVVVVVVDVQLLKDNSEDTGRKNNLHAIDTMNTGGRLSLSPWICRSETGLQSEFFPSDHFFGRQANQKKTKTKNQQTVKYLKNRFDKIANSIS